MEDVEAVKYFCRRGKMFMNISRKLREFMYIVARYCVDNKKGNLDIAKLILRLQEEQRKFDEKTKKRWEEWSRKDSDFWENYDGGSTQKYKDMFNNFINGGDRWKSWEPKNTERKHREKYETKFESEPFQNFTKCQKCLNIVEKEIKMKITVKTIDDARKKLKKLLLRYHPDHYKNFQNLTPKEKQIVGIRFQKFQECSILLFRKKCILNIIPEK